MGTNLPDDRPVDFSEILGHTVSGPVTSSPLKTDPVPGSLGALFGSDSGPGSLNSVLERLDSLNRSYNSMLALVTAKLGPVISPPEHTVGLEDIRSFFNWNAFSAMDPEKESELVIRFLDFMDSQYAVLSKLIYVLTTVQVGDSLKTILEANLSLLNGLKGEE